MTGRLSTASRHGSGQHVGEEVRRTVKAWGPPWPRKVGGANPECLAGTIAGFCVVGLWLTFDLLGDDQLVLGRLAHTLGP